MQRPWGWFTFLSGIKIIIKIRIKFEINCWKLVWYKNEIKNKRIYKLNNDRKYGIKICSILMIFHTFCHFLFILFTFIWSFLIIVQGIINEKLFSKPIRKFCLFYMWNYFEMFMLETTLNIEDILEESFSTFLMIEAFTFVDNLFVQASEKIIKIQRLNNQKTEMKNLIKQNNIIKLHTFSLIP